MQGKLDLIRCTEELVYWSIKSNASCIAVRLDHNRFSLQVVDNGNGIKQSELELFTSASNHVVSNISKSNSKNYSSCGKNFLDSSILAITQQCNSLTIESQLKSSRVLYKRHCQNGIWSGLECVGTRSSSGTTVTINDCLQVSQEEKDKLSSHLLLSCLKKLLASFFLLNPSVSFSLRSDPYHPPLLLTKKVKTTICAAQQLLQLEDNCNISPFCNSSRHFKLKGLIVLTKKKLPEEKCFIYVNSHAIESKEIVDVITNVLSLSKLTTRGQHFATVINIKCSRSMYEFILETENIRRACFSQWDELISLIRNSLDRFISDPLTSSDSLNSKVFKTAFVNRWLSTIDGSTVVRCDTTSKICMNKLLVEKQSEDKAFTLSECCTSPHLNEPVFPDSPHSHFGCLSVPHSSVLFGKVLDSVHDPLFNHLLESHEIRIVEPQILGFQNNSSSPSHLVSLWIDHKETPESRETDYQIGEKFPEIILEEISTPSQNFLKRMNCKRRYVFNDEAIEFRSKRNKRTWDHLNKTNTIHKFWLQPKLPPNIAFSSSGQLTLALPKNCTFTKSVMTNMRVLSQVDKKFVGCITQEKEQQYLLLIDQHAAHERVCLERLMHIHSTKDENGYIQVQSSPLHPHLKLSFPTGDFEILQKLSAEFSRYGLHLQFIEDTTVSVTSVPACFLAREINEIQRKRSSMYQELTMALLEETVAEFTKNGRLSTCLLPVQIRNVLNSLACHGAIKFGDELSQTQCTQLIKALGQCEVPFQCAHGRPLLAPLLELGELNQLAVTPTTKPNYIRLYNYSMH